MVPGQAIVVTVVMGIVSKPSAGRSLFLARPIRKTVIGGRVRVIIGDRFPLVLSYSYQKEEREEKKERQIEKIGRAHV